MKYDPKKAAEEREYARKFWKRRASQFCIFFVIVLIWMMSPSLRQFLSETKQKLFQSKDVGTLKESP